MDRDRYITLSQKGHDIAQDLNLDERIADTRNSDYYTTAEYIFESDYRHEQDAFHAELLDGYFTSNFYHSLQEHEKHHFLRALTLTECRGYDDEPKWSIPGAPSTDDLFGLPEISSNHPVTMAPA